MFGICLSYLFPIDITVNSAQRFKGSQLIGQLYGTKITCMPYFVTVFEMFEDGIVEVAVGIGKKAYPNHPKPIRNIVDR
jgi:hypothetical protein